MIYPNDRFRFSSGKERSGGTALRRAGVAFILVAAVVGGVLFSLRMEREAGPAPAAVPVEQQDIVSLWSEHRYREVMESSDRILAQHPLDDQALLFRGFAGFYLAVAQLDQEEKENMLQNAVFALRKAMLLPEDTLRHEAEYVLGKAYFHKGKYYADLAAQYIEQSLAGGYLGEDSHEYLGLSYAQIGEFGKSRDAFLQALEKQPTDLLYLALAQSCLALEDDNAAERYLREALEVTEDSALRQKSRFLLAQLYERQSAFEKAEAEYLAVIELNPKSAEAHFALGEIYNRNGDSVKARAEWRSTLRIDPNHYQARLRVYK